MTEYKTTMEDPHWREEEFQWASILEKGDPAKGMVLLYIQKLCTAFHEFEPAYKIGAINENGLGHFRKQLTARIERVLITMENNNLGNINGADELRKILSRTETADSFETLCGLTEEVHQVNHTLCEALMA